MHNEKILFLGYYCDDKKHEKCILSNADNHAQIGYVKALNNALPGSKFVSTNNVHGKSVNYNDEVNGCSVTFIGDGKRLKKIYKFINLYKELKKNRDSIVIYYNNLFLYNFVCYLLYCRYKLKFIPIIITDPYDIKSAKFIKKILYCLKKFFSSKILSKAYGEVLITNQMTNHSDNFAVINGGIDKNVLDEYKKLTKEKRDKLKITYTGALYYRYNLDKVIAAVNEFNGDIEFSLYGVGEDLEKILAMQNSKIQYCGNVNREQLMQVQKNSDILVAILNNDELSRKTFPSKIFEYLATGNEVIISNLDILDDDIKKLCHVVDKIDIASILNVINDISLKKIKKNNVKKSYTLLNEKYTWDANVKKLLSIIKDERK